jgi:thiol:disulfide interchange protein DsbC
MMKELLRKIEKPVIRSCFSISPVTQMIIKAAFIVAVVIMAWPQESKAEETAVKDPCSNVFQQIEEHAFLPEKFSVISKTPIDNLCEVFIEADKKLLTLYVSDNYVLVGDIFQDKRALTRRAIDEIEGRVVLENREQLEDCVAVSYTPVDRNLNRSIYMVTDPDCHFCKMANDEIIYLSERYGFNIKVILYPLGDENKSIEAACRKMTFDEYSSEEFALEEIKDNSHCETGTQKVEKSKAVLKKIGISAVPTFIFAETGQKIAGADMKKLEREIIVNLAVFEKQLVANAN